MPECSLVPKSYSLFPYFLYVALLNPKFNPYLLFKFLIFYHSSGCTDCYILAMYRCPIILYSRQPIISTDYYKPTRDHTKLSKLANLLQLLGSVMSRMYKNYLMLVSRRGATIHDLGVSVYWHFCITIQRYIVRYSKV